MSIHNIFENVHFIGYINESKTGCSSLSSVENKNIRNAIKENESIVMFKKEMKGIKRVPRKDIDKLLKSKTNIITDSNNISCCIIIDNYDDIAAYYIINHDTRKYDFKILDYKYKYNSDVTEYVIAIMEKKIRYQKYDAI